MKDRLMAWIAVNGSTMGATVLVIVAMWMLTA
jgi:hypothetical protein